MRIRLLQAAEARFLREGFVRTSIEAIVRDAATSKREYYRCFPDKEAIFLETVDRHLHGINSIASPLSGPPEKVLPSVARQIYLSHLSSLNLGLYRASISADRRSPGLARAVYESRAAMSKELGRYLDQWRRRRGLSFDDGFFAALRFGFLAIDGWRFQTGERPLSGPRQIALAREVADLFLNGHITGQARARSGAQCTRFSGILELSSANRAEASVGRRATRLDSSQWLRLQAEAWKEFVSEGYAGASIGAISRRTGMARTTIYRRYPSKKALFVALATRLIDATFDLRIRIDWEQMGVEAALLEVCSTLLDRFLEADNLDLQKILMVEAGNDPAMTHAIYEHMIARITTLLKPLSRALAAAGMLRTEHVEKAHWRLFVLTTFGGRFLYVPPRNRRERDALVREAVQVFLYGCRRPG